MEVFVAWNLIVFGIYGFDKYNAMTKRPRIDERTLLAFAFLFGGLGALLAMQVFRHKTRHRIFRIYVPVAVLINLICLYIIKRWHLI